MQVKVNFPIIFDLNQEEIEEYNSLTSNKEKIEFLLEIADYFFDTTTIEPEIELITSKED